MTIRTRRKRSPAASRRPARGEAAEKRARSAPLRRARQDRGAETRTRLIEAGLEVFGRLGFEGASTREIAKAADANLAAIVYHFGSKEALHLAVAEHVAGRIGALVGPTLVAVQTSANTADPKSARKALALLISAYADVMLGAAEADQWARFIVREQMQPTAAFEVFYQLLGNAHALACRLIAIATGGNPESEEIRLRMFMIMGQVLIFRVAGALVLRRLGWKSIGEKERAEIKSMLLRNVSLILVERI